MVSEMKSAVREFFINNYNALTRHDDIKVSAERAERYQELQNLYMTLSEKNTCSCFNSVQDILKAMKEHAPKDFAYIRDGKVVY